VTVPAVPARSSEPTDDELLAQPQHGVGRRILSGLLSYGIVIVALAYLFGQLSSGGDWTAALTLITGWMVVVAVVLGVVNLATNWPPISIALPGLRLREAAVTNTASAALSNTVPEGGAVATGLNYAMLRSWGFSLGDITSEVLVTGTWSQLMKYTLLAIGLVAVALEGWGPSSTPWWALALAVLVAAALVVLGLILRSHAFAERLGRWADGLVRAARLVVHRIPEPTMAESVPTFREALVSLLRLCWGRLTVAMLVSQLTVVLVLGICCRMQGLDEATISWAVILVAWGLVTFASLLVPTPGGLGVAELVLVAVLGYGLPQSDQAAVLAAVVLYRIATFLVPIPIGLVTYLYWRKSDAWRHEPGTRGPSSTKAAAATT
jgi:putative heme transporter